MSLRQNLLRARSHLIIVAVLLIGGISVVKMEEQALIRETGQGSPTAVKRAVPPPAVAQPSTPQEALPEATPSARATPEPVTHWEVQLGAFENAAIAREKAKEFRSRYPAADRLDARFERAGPLVRLRLAPLPDEAAAQSLCTAVVEEGLACFAVAPRAR